MNKDGGGNSDEGAADPKMGGSRDYVGQLLKKDPGDTNSKKNAPRDYLGQLQGAAFDYLSRLLREEEDE